MAGFNNKFESKKQEWTTPDNLYNKLHAEFKFEWDLAADASNSKCDKFYDENTNAFNHTWNGVCWVNPPYGSIKYKTIDWVKKAAKDSQQEGCVVVMLIPARTNNIWWHDYCMKAAEIRYICGRPKFGNCSHGLPQPLAIVVFRKHEGPTLHTSFHL
jgi:phage N-6-adenine-methyltransferase